MNDEAPALVPAGMIGELAYCPRLFALQWLHGEFTDNAHTVAGRAVHQRVDGPTRRGLAPAPAPEGPSSLNEEEPLAPPPPAVRSVRLSDPALGLLAVCDLVAQEPEGEVVPIEYKRGRAPDPARHPGGVYSAERAQVGVQALLLRAHGYRCDRGVVWYSGSGQRVEVPIDAALEAEVLGLRDAAQALLAAGPGPLPPPLIDSPKCAGCSLVGVCLPDEVNLLLGRHAGEVRPLRPARDDGIGVHVQLQGGSVGKAHDELTFKDKGALVAKHRVRDTTQVVIWGNASISTAALALLAEHGVPLSVHSSGGWYQGSFEGPSEAGALLRIAQHEARADAARRGHIAGALVQAKIKNQRVMLRRNADPAPTEALRQMAALAQRATEPAALEALMGVEGLAARHYFGAFSAMLRSPMGARFELDGRNRRPARDPVNALLSFAYACLARECAQVPHRVGFDVGAGFLHQPRPGRPALALDLMEPFRPLIADSAVISAVNRGAVDPGSFLDHPTGVALTDAGRRSFLRIIEARLDELATHPTLGTRCSMRRMLELEARLLARHLSGELPTLPVYTAR